MIQIVLTYACVFQLGDLTESLRGVELSCFRVCMAYTFGRLKRNPGYKLLETTQVTDC